MKRFLITTANETEWPADKSKPILFLGEWCKLYARKSEWIGKDFITQEYHWTDKEKNYSDYRYIKKLYEENLLLIAKKLGKLHNATTDVRYWEIIIGPWLRIFMDVLFDRYESIRLVKKNRN